MQPQQHKHALVMPLPGTGHINPMMHLTRLLASSGITITFVNTQYVHRHLFRRLVAQRETEEIPETVELDADGCPTAAPIRLVSIPDGVPDQDYVTTNLARIMQGQIDMTDDLTELAISLRPPLTSVIGDVFCVATPVVARRLQVPHIGFWTESAACYALHSIFASNPSHFKQLMTGDQSFRSIVGIPGCPPLTPTEVPSFLQSCDPSEFFFSIFTRNFGEEQMASHERVLINTSEAVEGEALEFVKGLNKVVAAIGPMISMEAETGGRKTSLSFWEEDEECVVWLGKQEEGSVLYVSFGSVAVLETKQAEELAAGLEASGCRVLMVARPALVYGDEAVLGLQRLAKLERVRFLRWAPQVTVLSHPSVGGFLTHAGWNSTMEAMANGVPMLCWPYFADQAMNARCIVDFWRIGLDLDRDESTGLIHRNEIETKVKRLMDPSSSNEIRRRARDLGISVKENHRSCSQPNLDSLLRFLSE